MTDFEPLERYLLGRRPQVVRPLEIQFNRLRGDVSGGLNGEALTARLDRLSTEVESLVAELEAQPAGRFGSAFLASFITIVREGVEVILILAMLLALVGKATSAARQRTLPEGNAVAFRGRGRRRAGGCPRGNRDEDAGRQGDLVGCRGGRSRECCDGGRAEPVDRLGAGCGAGNA